MAAKITMSGYVTQQWLGPLHTVCNTGCMWETFGGEYGAPVQPRKSSLAKHWRLKAWFIDRRVWEI